jgi:hypothetical protein
MAFKIYGAIGPLVLCFGLQNWMRNTPILASRASRKVTNSGDVSLEGSAKIMGTVKYIF